MVMVEWGTWYAAECSGSLLYTKTVCPSKK